ncbi:hypothetical protein FIE12Z_2191 [Fusarium flagelliforme]|uniref:Uncharacterized protein n=1 Tax=Fusarium flagelliforme TaxID=2675880 RepID=A0A395N085_9HYPO|nr:hypothetical protein FIE12Z_2191 [Fusarium flagelliforme]
MCSRSTTEGDMRMGSLDSNTEALNPVLVEAAQTSRQQFDEALWLAERSQEERTALNTRPDHVNVNAGWLSPAPWGLQYAIVVNSRADAQTILYTSVNTSGWAASLLLCKL